MTCPECGWPGVGQMPAGVRQMTQGHKTVLVGQLTYFSVAEEGALCSICEEMKDAVEARPWFIEAHREYLQQVKIKNKLMGHPREQ
jgi:hypothetical protein